MPTTINTPSQFVIQKHVGAGAPNYVDSQYIGQALQAGKPHMFEKLYMKMFSARSRFWESKPLIGGTGAKDGKIAGGTLEIKSDLFQWKLYGADTRTGRIVENLEAGNATVGINNSTFRIKIDLDYLHAPDVISLEDPEYQIEIIDGPIAEDVASIYICRLQTDNPSAFIDPTFLEQGRGVNKVSTSVGTELNTIGGSSRPFPGHLVLENQIGRFASTMTVTDEAWRTQGMLTIPMEYTDSMGKRQTTQKLLPLVEARIVDTHYTEIEYSMMYGKRSTRPAPNGYIKRTGSGLREQLKDSWNKYTSGMITEDLLVEYLMDVFFSRVDEGDRKQTAQTGTVGSLQLHRMLASRAQSLLTVDTHWVKELSKNPRHLSYGSQFTHYQGPEGIEFMVNKLWQYDNKEYNSIPHPYFPKFPIDSGRFTFLNWGTAKAAGDEYSGSNNIMMLKRENVFANIIKPGRLKPTGPVTSGEVTSLVPGYEHFIESSAGIVVFDPTLCGEIITDVNAM